MPENKHWNIEGKSRNKSTGAKNVYKVTRYGTGSWACSCPAWINERGTKEPCKHILKVQLAESITTGVAQVVESNLGIAPSTSTNKPRVFKEIK